MNTFTKIGLILLCVLPFRAIAGDTIHVVTHNRETVVTDPSKGNKEYIRWGVFPKPGEALRKIIMHVNFACPDTMRCADWDYSDRISILRQGGIHGKLQDYEIGRILTPYGGAFGKNWHFEWEVDVTDFSLLLRDSVEISYNHSGYEPANDRGWAITLDFEIIKGRPAAEQVSIQKIYDAHFGYGDSLNPIEKKLIPVSFTADEGAAFARLRVIQTGHGMDEPDGCGEFCKKTREIWYDGKMADSKAIWKKCGENPLYPQAGTWIYDRAGWCPGDLVQPDIYDINIIPGTAYSIAFKMTSYVSPKPSANEVISAYLVQYKKPSAENDVSVEDVVVPSSKMIYSRMNPATSCPQIIVRNSGSSEVHSISIRYGTAGFASQEYSWTGLLEPDKSATITLPWIIKYKAGINNFSVSLENPGGKNDGYPADNSFTVPFQAAPVLDTLLVFYLLTNNQPSHNSWILSSADAGAQKERKAGSLEAKTIYSDTLKLKPGAYQLAFADTAGDGLEFWYNTDGGRGIARLMNGKGELLKSFESDCGSGWVYNFTVGARPDPVNPDANSIGLYPTRTSDFTTLDYFANKTEDVTVRLISDPGKEVVEEHLYPKLKQGMFTYDLRRYPSGRFYLKVLVNNQEKFSKRIRYTAEPPANAEPPYDWPKDSLVSRNLKTWQDWKFGILIHWGAYSEWGVVESWSLCPEDEGWCVRRGPYSSDWYTYKKAYEDIRKTFYPDKFNPEHWAKAAHDAGMKYVVFTTKHHDGFCMFDTKFTNYRITDAGSAFSKNPRSNVVKEVFTAFRQQGMAIGAYFSKPDWHCPDYWWPYFPALDRNVNYDPSKYPDRWKSFQKFTYNQIDEITRDYGKIDILWLDGGQVRPANTLTEETRPWLGKHLWIQDVDMPSIAKMARKNQPGILIVDRTVHGEFENYRTPEQQIPVNVPAYPWESCITLGDSWYHTGPGEHYKSLTWAIHTLVKIVAKGGNLLLGIGPDKTGEFAPEAYERLKQIGDWMKVNGEAIYNSRPLAPYQAGDLCFTQSKDGKTKYLFYLVKENDAIPASVELPAGFAGKASEIKVLGYPQTIKIKEKNGKKLLTLPESFLKGSVNSPAFVFRISEK